MILSWHVHIDFSALGRSSVDTGLLGPTPVTIAGPEASIQQAIDPGQNDQFVMQAPVKVVGISLTIKAIIIMPLETVAQPLLHPFAPVSLGPGHATLSYSDGTSTTVLAIQTGSLTGTIPATKQ